MIKKLTYLITIFCVCISTLSSAQIPTDSLLCHYPFNNTFNDVADTNHGTNYGATFAIDRFGNANRALYLDSVDWVDFGNVDLTEPNFSISLWVNFDTTVGTPWYILSKRPACSVGNFMNVGANSNGVGMELYSGSNSSGNAAPGGTINNNNWHHVVLIANDTNQQTYKYIDGILATTKNWGTPMGSIANSASLVLSESPCIGVNGSDHYKGFVDDIRIYKRPIDSTEVVALFNEPNPVTPPPPPPSGLTDKNDDIITVFPNPSNGIINIKSETDIQSISIMDFTGKVVLSKNQVSTIDIYSLETGIYFLEINTKERRYIRKVIKQ